VDILYVFTSPFTKGKGGNGMLDSIRTRLLRDEGQALVEYTLILSLIAVVCVAALSVMGTSLSDIIDKIAGTV
jgi:pilus assembly protein Flp/PilA